MTLRERAGADYRSKIRGREKPSSLLFPGAINVLVTLLYLPPDTPTESDRRVNSESFELGADLPNSLLTARDGRPN